ncbi:glycoside hydrolase family protein [Salix suchowensis]|nr:glycoside hydrolase family protein [Salix suchowensis]
MRLTLAIECALASLNGYHPIGPDVEGRVEALVGTVFTFCPETRPYYRNTFVWQHIKRSLAVREQASALRLKYRCSRPRHARYSSSLVWRSRSNLARLSRTTSSHYHQTLHKRRRMYANRAPSCWTPTGGGRIPFQGIRIAMPAILGMLRSAPSPSLCQNCALEGADYAATYGIRPQRRRALNFVTSVHPAQTSARASSHGRHESLPDIQAAEQGDLVRRGCVAAPVRRGRGDYFVDMQLTAGCRALRIIMPGHGLERATAIRSAPHEMDIFQGNILLDWRGPSLRSSNQYRCQDEIECGERYDYTYAYENPCDKDGCEFNTQSFVLRPGGTVDTNHKFTVTTQFITDTGEDDGDVVEIRRSYKQNDNDIPYRPSPESGMGTFGPYESITDNYCADLKQAFGEVPAFTYVGGLENTITPSGRVLVMSISNDYYNRDATWLDSGAHGPCPAYNADDVELESPSAKVVFSNIRFGEIGSTN